LKISLKDNEIPEALEKFDELGFDFQNELVVHIVKEVFEKTFGIGARPNSNDFIYLPLTDKMYQLNSPYDPKTFMQFAPFWEVMTTKYEKRSSVIGQNDEEHFHKVDDMIDFTEDYFALEQKIEMADAVKDFNKPDQLSKLDDNHIVSDDKPINNDMSLLYSFSTMNAEATNIVKSYTFYNNYKDNNIMLMMWLKFSSTTKTAFVMSSADGLVQLQMKLTSASTAELSLLQHDGTTQTINFNIELDKFRAYVIVFDFASYTLSLEVYNTKKKLLVESHTTMLKPHTEFAKLDMYGKIKYNLLRVCK
jgi:hypothetical protein